MTAKKDNTPSETLKISQVADRAGVSKQTVEYYIMLGLLQPKRQPKTRRRIFTPAHVKRIQLIRKLNKTGYTLREIREIFLKKK